MVSERTTIGENFEERKIRDSSSSATFGSVQHLFEAAAAARARLPIADRRQLHFRNVRSRSDQCPIDVDRTNPISHRQSGGRSIGGLSLSHWAVARHLRGSAQLGAARRSSARLGAARHCSAQLGTARHCSAQLGTARRSSAQLGALAISPRSTRDFTALLSRFHRAALAISPRSTRDFTAQHSRFHRAARAISPRSTRAFGRVVATALARYARVAVTNTHGNGVKRQRSEPASSLQAFAVFPMGRFARSTVRRRERGYRASAVATAPPQEEITVALRSLLVWRPQRRSCLVSRTVPTMTTTIYGKRLLGGCAARRSSGRPLTSSARGKDMHARRWQAAQSLLATKRLVTDMQGGGGGRARGVRGAGVSVLRRRFTTVSPFHRFTVSPFQRRPSRETFEREKPIEKPDGGE